jgi:hypothetical protein
VLPDVGAARAAILAILCDVNLAAGWKNANAESSERVISKEVAILSEGTFERVNGTFGNPAPWHGLPPKITLPATIR